jgi:hypothetical protein
VRVIVRRAFVVSSMLLAVGWLNACGADAGTASSTDDMASASAGTASAIDDQGAVRARLSVCTGMPLLFTVATLRTEPFSNLQGDVEGCVAAASDCTAVRACLGLQHDCIGSNRCEGDRAVTCEEIGETFNAERYDECGQSPDNPFCTLVDVGTGPGAVCNAGACEEGEDERCDGDVAVACQGGVQVRTPCGPGRTCRLGAAGVFCSEPKTCSHDYCDGNSVVFCREGVVESRHDCAAFVANGFCRDDHGSVDCRSRLVDPECSEDEPFSEGCDGEDGFACYVGARYRVTCSSFAARCVISDSGTASCQPL